MPRYLIASAFPPSAASRKALSAFENLPASYNWKARVSNSCGVAALIGADEFCCWAVVTERRKNSISNVARSCRIELAAKLERREVFNWDSSEAVIPTLTWQDNVRASSDGTNEPMGFLHWRSSQRMFASSSL